MPYVALGRNGIIITVTIIICIRRLQLIQIIAVCVGTAPLNQDVLLDRVNKAATAATTTTTNTTIRWTVNGGDNILNDYRFARFQRPRVYNARDGFGWAHNHRILMLLLLVVMMWLTLKGIVKLSLLELINYRVHGQRLLMLGYRRRRRPRYFKLIACSYGGSGGGGVISDSGSCRFSSHLQHNGRRFPGRQWRGFSVH